MKYLLATFLLLLLVIFYYLFYNVPFTWLYFEPSWIPLLTFFILIFFLAPLATYKLLNSFWSNHDACVALALLPIIPTGFSFGVNWADRENNQLKIDGVEDVGVAVDKRYFRNDQGTQIKVMYNDGLEDFKTGWLDDDDDVYQIGDSVDIIYSLEYPMIVEILETD